MDLTRADLRILTAALDDRLEKLQVRLHLGDKGALSESREVKALANRIGNEIRETAPMTDSNRYTVDEDGMMWAA